MPMEAEWEECPVLSEHLDQLLREYVRLQEESRRINAERGALKMKIAEILSSRGEEDVDVSVDGEMLHVRCQPKISYKIDSSLLRQRLGSAYYSVLVPDTQKLKANMDEVLCCLAPIIDKVGIPSGERIDAAIAAGELDSALVSDVVSRTPDYSFAVTHPSNRHLQQRVDAMSRIAGNAYSDSAA